MKTPEDVITLATRPKRIYWGAKDIIDALDAAGYVIVRKGEDTLSPEKAEEIAKEATTQLQGHTNVRINPSWNLGPLKR